MERVNRIVNNERYIEELVKIKRYEKDREFCGHDKDHFINVSRILSILTYEEGMKIKKDVVYAIGFLHDIGRGVQYEEGIPHEKSSCILAKGILKESGYTGDEIEVILKGIKEHRKFNSENSSIGKLTYKADKLSRECWNCNARKNCNWEKMNNEIIY